MRRLNVATDTLRRRMNPGSQGRLWPSIICRPKIRTGVPTIPATPAAQAQFGGLNRISTKPKARSPKAPTISPIVMLSPSASSITPRRTAERSVVGSKALSGASCGSSSCFRTVWAIHALLPCPPVNMGTVCGEPRFARRPMRALRGRTAAVFARRRSVPGAAKPPRGAAPADGRDAMARPVRSSVSTATPDRVPSPPAPCAGRESSGESGGSIPLSAFREQVIVAAHAGIGHVGGAAADPMIGGRYMRVSADHEAHASVEIVGQRLLLARRLRVDIDDRRIGDLGERTGSSSRSRAAKGSSSGSMKRRPITLRTRTRRPE